MGALGKRSLAAGLMLAASLVAPAPAAAQVSGRLMVTESGGRVAADLGDAVVFIEGRGPRLTAAGRNEMAMDARQFRPRVMVIAAGASVTFPNLDPFNHNVFSLSEGNAFDLGLYGRRESRARRFARAGLVRIYCNIHPRMSAFLVVRDNAWYAQPGADGSFTVADVPPGTYTLKAWHERGGELEQEITVPRGGLSGLSLSLDASGYRWVQHRNKYGQEYGATREIY